MIHFSCPHCQKLLFARPEYAQRRGPCPGCGVIISIPLASQPGPGLPFAPTTAVSPAAVLPGNDNLIDMELGPEAAAVHGQPRPAAQAYPPRSEFAQRFDAQLPPRTMNLVPPSPTGASASGATQAAVPAQDAGVAPANDPAGPSMSAAPVAAAVPIAPATRRCPTCAETIQADAKRCRFCGAILDERLRAEAQAEQAEQQRQLLHKRATAMAEKNVGVWRSISVIVTSFTVGWLFYLSLVSMFHPEPPWAGIIFNALLMLGLLRTSREMKSGPASMFAAAGLALIACMPLDMMMGLFTIDNTMVEEFKKSTPPGQAPLTREQIEAFVFGFFTFAGFIFSIPLWITAAKVASLQRLRQSMGKDSSGSAT